MNNIFFRFRKWIQNSHNLFIFCVFLEFSWWAFRNSAIGLINNPSFIFIIDQIFVYFFFLIFIMRGIQFIKERVSLVIFPVRGIPAILIGVVLIIALLISLFLYTKQLFITINKIT
jgi:hypothetical protein